MTVAFWRAGENVWALGDVTGIAPFTHVGKYHARIAAYDMAGRDVQADHRAVPATIFTDPQVATVGDTEGGVSSTWDLASVPRLSTYERPKQPGFVKVVADPERRVLKGAVAKQRQVIVDAERVASERIAREALPIYSANRYTSRPSGWGMT